MSKKDAKAGGTTKGGIDLDAEARARAAELAERVERYRASYYKGKPEISDAAFDALEDELRAIDPTNPVLAKVGSAELVSEWEKARHEIPMGSLNKAVNEAELMGWLDRCDELLQKDGVGAIRGDLFGEGIAPWKDRIVSITWQSGIGFIWRRKDFEQIRSFTYPGEGWGITSDDRWLIMSDGSAQLRFLDPETQAEKRRVTVTWDGQPVRNLNELEFARGAVYANIWYSPMIAKIDPGTGAVIDWINLSLLVAQNIRRDPGEVLNGANRPRRTASPFWASETR